MSDPDVFRRGRYDVRATSLRVRGRPPTAATGRIADLADASSVLATLWRRSRRAPWQIADLFNALVTDYPEEWGEVFDALNGRYSLGTIERWAKVARAYPPRERTRIDEVSIDVYQACQSLSETEREAVIETAVTEEQTIAQVRQAARKAKRTRRTPDPPEGGTPPDPLPSRFRVVYVTPDWETWGVDQVAAVPLPVGNDAAVFVLMTEHERDSLRLLLEAWDVRHVGTVIWDRVDHLRPHAYLSIRHEYLIWCVRGKCSPDVSIPLLDSVLVRRWGSEHAGPPADLLELIDSRYTHGFKVQLGALPGMAPRPGWRFCDLDAIPETPAETYTASA